MLPQSLKESGRLEEEAVSWNKAESPRADSKPAYVMGQGKALRLEPTSEPPRDLVTKTCTVSDSAGPGGA